MFWIESHTGADKSFRILGPFEPVIEVDYDDVNHKAVDRDAKKLVRILNANWNSKALNRSERELLQDYEKGFELRYNADTRAIDKWRAATKRTMVLPDHADLCVWLLQQLDSLGWGKAPFLKEN